MIRALRMAWQLDWGPSLALTLAIACMAGLFGCSSIPYGFAYMIAAPGTGEVACAVKPSASQPAPVASNASVASLAIPGPAGAIKAP